MKRMKVSHSSSRLWYFASFVGQNVHHKGINQSERRRTKNANPNFFHAGSYDESPFRNRSRSSCKLDDSYVILAFPLLFHITVKVKTFI